MTADDVFVDTAHSFTSAFGLNVDKEMLFTVLYNLVPALIFGPLLVYKGRKYKDTVLTVIGIALIVADTLHFVKAVTSMNSAQ